MSDTLRKPFGDQVHDKVKPDSQKSYTESATDTVTGVADKVGSAIQPEGDKSATQSVGDTFRGNADSAQNSGGSLLDKTKDTASGAADYVTDRASSLTDSLKGKTEETKQDL